MQTPVPNASTGRISATPIFALLVVMLLAVAGINAARSDRRPPLSVGSIGENPAGAQGAADRADGSRQDESSDDELGKGTVAEQASTLEAPSVDNGEQVDEARSVDGDEPESGDTDQAQPTSTPVATTAPMTIPPLAPAVSSAAADDRGTRNDAGSAETPSSNASSSDTLSSNASSSDTGGAARAAATTTPIPTAVVTALATATAAPTPVATVQPTPIPTATPLPAPTATPLPVPTATPFPTATPIPAASTTPIPAATAIPTATPVPVLTGDTDQMETFVFEAINAVRSRAGLAPVQLRSDISSIARDWSEQMARAGGISHRPRDQLSDMLPTGWRSWAENVAEAPTIQWTQSALEGSASHYANMTGAYNSVGIGVAIASNGQIFVTHNFASY